MFLIPNERYTQKSLHKHWPNRAQKSAVHFAEEFHPRDTGVKLELFTLISPDSELFLAENHLHREPSWDCMVKVTQSCPTLRHQELYSPWNSPGQTTGVGSLSLLQGIFPTQQSNPGLPHCRQILYLSHQGSPRILEWVAYPFSSRSAQPRNRTCVSCITGRFFTN